MSLTAHKYFKFKLSQRHSLYENFILRWYNEQFDFYLKILVTNFAGKCRSTNHYFTRPGEVQTKKFTKKKIKNSQLIKTVGFNGKFFPLLLFFYFFFYFSAPFNFFFFTGIEVLCTSYWKRLYLKNQWPLVSFIKVSF